MATAASVQQRADKARAFRGPFNEPALLRAMTLLSPIKIPPRATEMVIAIMGEILTGEIPGYFGSRFEWP